MKIIILLCLISLPMSGYAQFVIRDVETQELSAESKILIEQAKNKNKSFSKKKDLVQNAESFNLAVTSSFTGGIIPNYTSSHSHSTTVDLFNATSLEFYFPALKSTPKTRFLMTARFFTPVLGEGIGNSMYLPRLGYGIGFSSIIFNGRNNKGQGWTVNMNFLFSQDFNFLDLETSNDLIEAGYSINRIDFGLRWNYFMNRNFALVFGLDIGGGVAFEEHDRLLGSDGYPIEPLTPYGFSITGIINIGLTVGFMF